MTKKPSRYQSLIEEVTEVCNNGIQTSKSWPFRLKLTTDRVRWDSLKISPSHEFEEHILAKLDEASRKALDAWIPIEIHIIDVDIRQSYKVNLVKKESFWFQPVPDVGQKVKKSSSYDIEKDMKGFAYSVEPFKHILKRRSLSYDHEIGLRWSGSRTSIKFDFSVLYAPRLELHSLRI